VSERPILFLDVDGVLNSNEHKTRGDVWGMSGYHISQLARVLRATGCQIVVSSSWRRGGIGPGSDFYEQLIEHAFGGAILREVIDSTPLGEKLWTDGAYNRGWEIAHWLGEHPGVTCFAIVDDDEDAGSYAPERFVQTTMRSGLTPALADRLIALLCESETTTPAPQPAASTK